MDRRNTWRDQMPKAKKVISAQAEKIDQKIKIPKMVTGAGMACVAIVVKIYLPVIPFMDILFVTGMGTFAAGLGIKINRAKKGGKFWKHEKEIFNKITKRGK